MTTEQEHARRPPARTALANMRSEGRVLRAIVVERRLSNAIGGEIMYSRVSLGLEASASGKATIGEELAFNRGNVFEELAEEWHWEPAS